MKHVIFFAVFFSFVQYGFPQNAVGIGTAVPDASAVLDVKSSGKGMLIPRMTENQRMNIETPAKGLMVYQTTSPEGFYFNSGTAASPLWTMISAAKKNAFSVTDLDQAIDVFNVTDVPLPFSAELYDLGNNYLTSSSLINPNTFTAPVSGIYHFDGVITWSGFDTDFGGAFSRLNVNGSRVFEAAGDPVIGDDRFSLIMSADVKLNAGDRVQFCAFQSSGHMQSIRRYENRFSGRLAIE